jgi:hypothetical protein
MCVDMLAVAVVSRSVRLQIGKKRMGASCTLARQSCTLAALFEGGSKRAKTGKVTITIPSSILVSLVVIPQTT